MPAPAMDLKTAASNRPRAPRVAMHYEISVQGVQQRVELPFVTGVIADLSGRPSEALPRVAERSFVEIDRDNFDFILASIGQQSYRRMGVVGIREHLDEH